MYNKSTPHITGRMLTWLVCLLLLSGKIAQAQQATNAVTIQLRNASIEQACSAIEKAAGITFTYNDSKLRLYKGTISLETTAPLTDILNRIFNGSALKWSLKGKMVVLTEDPEYKQQRTDNEKKGRVTGVVTEASTATPVPGVVVRSGKYAAVTDAQGHYDLALPVGKSDLSLSHVSYGTQLVKGIRVDEDQVLNQDVALSISNSDLKGVVVVGYGKQSRKLLTSSITTVGNGDFNKGNFNNPAQLLQGKVAGLTITRSGDPNAAPSVTLRGPSTLRTGAAQEPFYVIDGIPGADIRLVAPDDIATIDVLKDASATAIYGTRATNGVIIITTKRGSEGQLQLNYATYVSFESVARRIKMMDANQLNDYLGKNNLAQDPSDKQGANTDWQKEISRNAVSQNHYLSMSGGAKNTVFNASLNYFDNKGILKGSQLKRIIGRATVEQRMFEDHLRLGLNIASTNSTSNIIPNQDIVLYNSMRYLPTVPVRQPNGAYTENLQRVQYYNPVALMDNAWQKNESKVSVINAYATVKLPWGFKYDLNVTSQTEQLNTGAYYTSQYTLKTGINGEAIRSAYQNKKTILESFFTFDKKLGQHDINLLGGYSWQEDVNGDGFQANNQNFPTDALGYMNIGLGNPAAGFKTDFGPNDYQKLRLISFYVRGKYNLGNKYLLQASVRRDASSAFGINNRWATFPAVSLAWRVIQEPFMQHQQLFNDLKLRVGYGVTGNSLGFNPMISKFRNSTTGTFFYNGQFVNAIGPSQNANPDLKWEKTAMLNVGVDFSILKGKINGSIEYYDKKTTDLIWYYTVSTTQFATNTFTANVGSISNKGIELTLDATPVQTKKFSWNTSFNLAHNRNVLLSLSNDRFKLDSIFQAEPGGQGQTGSMVQILKSGYPVGQFFTLRYAGKNENGVSQFYGKDGKLTTSPQNFKDYFYAGNAQPKLLLGWNNSFRYGNFDLNIFLRASLGGKIMNATLADLNRPDDVRSYNLPASSADESPRDGNAYKYSDRYIENASYLRLDNMTLGYTFQHFRKNIRSIRLYVSGNNLGILTGYKGIDPELNLGGLTPGIDNKNYYPRTRAFLFGLNASF
ncbi:SusC/RagA family TonB-linked outer membrane protein [Chitinophaga pendula]|uniref:SusC/RagA family TonB-linked outer membrane protein n=1 Tax=Chitinophaga TaxID=79328 RepID=UPI0018DFC52D|nr:MULTISPECIES: SusC/RagA family TonB-linked outer membrane protein [Chitinophaga]UCJ08966.1 SusC/RagA family TonB-linked outer membrane protein [Chitinophaga pendula]